MKIDYSLVSEIPGQKATKDQLSIIYTRYRFAAGFCQDKTVLEVGCGAGIGLSYLTKKAKKVIGGDCSEDLLRYGQKNHGGKAGFVNLDAHILPFKTGAFDILILFETLYYLQDADKFLNEARRILKVGGKIFISTVNKNWADFSPSLYSTEYFSAPQLCGLLNKYFKKVHLYGVFLADNSSKQNLLLSRLKRLAVRLDLIPRTMKSKSYLKRIFFGRLTTLPVELKDGVIGYDTPVAISGESLNPRYRILYAVGDR